VKIVVVLMLSAFLVVLPALVSACELRCASVQSTSHAQSTSHTPPMPVTHCSGHPMGKTGSTTPVPAPATEHGGCGGHALLARGTVPALEFSSPLLASAPGIPIPASLELAAGLMRLPEPASSPPPRPSLSVLRL
jgi:hypothetical protein